MSPKFSLGVALGFAAIVIARNKPHGRAVLRPPVPAQPTPATPDTDALDNRLAAVEADLDHADRLILEQAKAEAARAFRPVNVLSASALSARLAQMERQAAAARGALEAFLSTSSPSIAACRETLETWIAELPERVNQTTRESAQQPPELALDLPPAPEGSPAPAGTASNGLAPRLARQAEAIADLTVQAAALKGQLSP